MTGGRFAICWAKFVTVLVRLVREVLIRSNWLEMLPSADWMGPGVGAEGGTDRGPPCPWPWPWPLFPLGPLEGPEDHDQADAEALALADAEGP